MIRGKIIQMLQNDMGLGYFYVLTDLGEVYTVKPNYEGKSIVDVNPADINQFTATKVIIRV